MNYTMRKSCHSRFTGVLYLFLFLMALTQTRTHAVVVLHDKLWPNGSQLRVGFLPPVDASHRAVTAAQRNLIMSIASTWSLYGNISFVHEPNAQLADIRIRMRSGTGGSSHIGIDAQHIAPNDSTMMFGVGNMHPGNAYGRRTILHEFGHAIGLMHEHQGPPAGINWQPASVILNHITNVWRIPGWTLEMVRFNIVDELAVSNFNYGKYDVDSIMIYHIPTAWTTDGYFVNAKTVLSETDKAGIRWLYPFEDDCTMVFGEVHPSPGNGNAAEFIGDNASFDGLMTRFHQLFAAFDGAEREARAWAAVNNWFNQCGVISFGGYYFGENVSQMSPGVDDHVFVRGKSFEIRAPAIIKASASPTSYWIAKPAQNFDEFRGLSSAN